MPQFGKSDLLLYACATSSVMVVGVLIVEAFTPKSFTDRIREAREKHTKGKDF